MRLAIRTLLVAIVGASLALSAAGCSESDANAMTRSAGDFMIAVVTGDGELLMTTVPSALAEEHPEFFETPEDRPEIATEYNWDGDTLLITFGEDGEARLEPSPDGEPIVIGTFPDGSQTSITLVETTNGWRVTEIDGMDVAELLAIAMGSMDTLGASVDQDTCFMGQLSVELAAETLAAAETSISLDPADYVPTYFDTPTFCPDPESQYSEANSEFGHLEGLAEDGSVAPCSVHGYYDAVP